MYRHLFFSVTFLFLLHISSQAQSKLSICAGVDGEGNCYLTNSKYITSPGKEDGLFFMLVSNQNGLNTSGIDFRVYTVNNQGEETLSKSVRQEVGSDWVFAWKSEMFSSPGKYSVEVFDSNGNQLDKKSFELIRFQ